MQGPHAAFELATYVAAVAAGLARISTWPSSSPPRGLRRLAKEVVGALVAACVVLTVARWRLAVLPAAMAIVVMALGQARYWPRDDRVHPVPASIVDAARARWQTPCA